MARDVRAWIAAARPLAHANIAPAIALGEALAYRTTGHFSWTRALLVHGFGICDHLFIVFSNDVADRESDSKNRTFNAYSGGSRVLPEGRISPRALAHAAFAMACATLGFGGGLAFDTDEPWFVALAFVAILLMLAYSFAPLKLSYRGGGEALQGLGIGVVLPLAGYLAQDSLLARIPLRVLVATFVLGFAGNIVTALPDTPSDRATSKRTWPVRHGELRARRDALVLLVGAIGLALATTPPLGRGAELAVALPALGAIMLAARGLRSADAENHAACMRFVTFAGGAIGWVLVAWSVALVTARQ